jgi:hypothetical protein
MLSLPGKILQNFLTPKAEPSNTLQRLRIEPEQAPPVRARSLAEKYTQQQANSPRKEITPHSGEKAFGQLPRRIRRIMNLAREGGFSKGAQIENIHVSGLWAVSFVRCYEKASPNVKNILETHPMEYVFEKINSLIEKGAI